MELVTPSSIPFPGSLWEMTRFSRVITFIGAGGKSTCLKALTSELSQAGKNVIATTTTKVFPMALPFSWMSLDKPPDLSYPCFWYADEDTIGGKWSGPATHIIDAAIASEKQCFQTVLERFWVIEGDGARSRKLKCWSAHEPQIPLKTECAVLLIDGELTGRVLTTDDIHRGELCPSLVGSLWNSQTAWDYLFNSPAFYPSYNHMSWVILFNEFGTQNKNRVFLDELAETVSRLPRNKHTVTEPVHLRIATGNAREMKLIWYDLW